MSNQLHDSEGGPRFRIKHCNLIMCGLIRGPCSHPQPCTASSTWLDSEIPRGGGGRKEEEEGGEEGAELPRFCHTAASSPTGTRCVSGFSQPGRRRNPGNPQTGCHRQVFVGQRRLEGFNLSALLSRETLFICRLKRTAKRL